MIQLPLDSPPITGQPYLLREMWDSHMSYTTWPSFTCDHKCSPGPVKLVQFVDVPIFQPWPTLQFVLLAPISHLGQPFWFIYSCKYFFFLLQLNFREEEFSHDTVLWESLHTDEWYWKRWGGKSPLGFLSKVVRTVPCLPGWQVDSHSNASRSLKGSVMERRDVVAAGSLIFHHLLYRWSTLRALNPQYINTAENLSFSVFICHFCLVISRTSEQPFHIIHPTLWTRNLWPLI